MILYQVIFVNIILFTFVIVEKDITDRIELILKEYNLSPSAFSDLIQVQRSAMSHILSRRNRPSLDVIQKILKEFPDINSQWLLTGLGKMKQLNLFEEEGKNEKKQGDDVSAKQDKTTPPSVDTFKPSKVLTSQDFDLPSNAPQYTYQPAPVTPPTEVNFPSAPVTPVSTPYVAPQHPLVPPAENYRNDDHGQDIKNSPPANKTVPPLASSDIVKEEPTPVPKSTDRNAEEAKALGQLLGEKEIDKIVIFYKDRTFVSYRPD